MPIIGGLDIHRKQLTFDCLDTVAGEAVRGQVSPADREHLRGGTQSVIMSPGRQRAPRGPR